MGQGKISAKQQEILDYIKSQILERGFPPAVRDAAAGDGDCTPAAGRPAGLSGGCHQTHVKGPEAAIAASGPLTFLIGGGSQEGPVFPGAESDFGEPAYSSKLGSHVAMGGTYVTKRTVRNSRMTQGISRLIIDSILIPPMAAARKEFIQPISRLRFSCSEAEAMAFVTASIIAASLI